MSDYNYAGNRINKRTLLTAIMLLFIIPGSILSGVFFLNDRKYYFISLIIIICAIIPFILVFENRKPQARELVVIAVLSAIAVAGRTAFYMVPQFKPVIAVVIVAGVCFGSETGLLVGVISGFVSNFFFGQGPWTPWQMFSFGLIGFFAGVLFNKGILKRSRLSLCVFGGLATFFIYGGMMNISSVLMSTSQFSWEVLLITCISGFWFDLVHSVSTITFLFFISHPLIEKLDRISIKYGLIHS